eukprot:Filipodium_phascolosomae@DN7966_c0_g1_i1.p1
MAGYEVELNDGQTTDFYVKMNGPKDTPYSSGVWRVHVTLPDHYPYSSPSIGFVNKILHPNVDEISGSVCLDVINQTWTPMYSLLNIFEVFLPQLLTYPNASDPLNNEAALLLMRDKNTYEKIVREHVCKHASPEDACIWPEKASTSISKGSCNSDGTSNTTASASSNNISTSGISDDDDMSEISANCAEEMVEELE